MKRVVSPLLAWLVIPTIVLGSRPAVLEINRTSGRW